MRAVAALGVAPSEIESYGKAAIVGEAANWSMRPPSCTRGWERRCAPAVEKGAALVPSAKKLGGLGTPIDVPLGHKDAAFVRSHFDAMEVRIADAPRRDEIVVAVVVTELRPAAAARRRADKDQIKGEDGLRSTERTSERLPRDSRPLSPRLSREGEGREEKGRTR